MADSNRVVSMRVLETVEHYVYKELDDSQKYENRTPLDESGIWSLHALAAEIYAMGYEDGERVEARRQSQSNLRLQRHHRDEVKKLQVDKEDNT